MDSAAGAVTTSLMAIKTKTLAVSEDWYMALLKQCPDGYKIRAFHERVLKLGLEALKKEGKKT